MKLTDLRLIRRAASVLSLASALCLGAAGAIAETNAPPGTVAAPSPITIPKDAAQPAPSSPTTKTPPSATPPTPTPQSAAPATPPAAAEKTPAGATPAEKPATPPSADKPLAPEGKPSNNEIEPNGSPGIPDNATTENVDVPARPLIMVKGQSTYDEAFKSIKASMETVRKAMDKAGLKPSGHPITIFSEPDDKGFKYEAAIPVAAKPDKTDLGDGISVGVSPAGKAIKFQHRGAYDDIDSTYDVITAFLDAKGMQVDSPYIEEYLTDLTTADDPNLQVDIYVFVK